MSTTVSRRLRLVPFVWSKALAEGLGTFLMVFIGCGSIALGWSGPAVSLTFGIAVTMVILTLGGISGAHINPAVSVAFWRDGKLSNSLIVPYIIAQFLGALLAAVLLGGVGPTMLDPSISYLTGFSIEVAITAILMASILQVVQRTETRWVIALWVGATVAILAFLVGPLTGASMNPARTFGPNLVSGLWPSLLFYFTSTFIGAWLACDIKRAFFPDKVNQD